MGLVLGSTLGAGLYLIWLSVWQDDAPRPGGSTWNARTQDLLIQAGAPRVTPRALVGTSVAVALVAFILTAGLTSAPAIGLALAALASRAPFALVSARARARAVAMRDVWPEAVDHLASGVRAGLALPEAVTQLGDRGPAELQAPFREFGADYRATGRFGDSLDALKARLADPIADRIVESLRVTRDVGGTDLGRVLRALSAYLREDARTRGELEARQSWTVNAARLAVAAPWLVLLALGSRPEAAQAYNTPAGVTVLAAGATMTMVAYRLMIRVGRLPAEQRVMR